MSLREPVPSRLVYDKELGRMVLNPVLKAFVHAQFDAVQAAVDRQNAEMRAGLARREAAQTDDAP